MRQQLGGEMESLAAALMPEADRSSTETSSQSNAKLNRLLDEITFRLERRFLLRLFDKHGIPSSQLDKLPPLPNCQCQCRPGGRDTIPSTATPHGSGYEDIEILQYRARSVVDNVVGDALRDAELSAKRNQQYTEYGDTSERSVETDMFATIGGPDNMSATNSLYVVRRAALRTLLKYTCKGKASALLHLTDYLQKQIDNIDEENADLDMKAKIRKPRVRFDPIVEERDEEFDDTFDEHDDILTELPEPMKDRSKKTVAKIQTAYGDSHSEQVSLDSNYTFNLRKFARSSLCKYLHKTDAAAAMMHLFESTTRLELADDFAEFHASDSDMQELLHTPYFGSIASSGAAPKTHHASPDRHNKRTPHPARTSTPDKNNTSSNAPSVSRDSEQKFATYQPHHSPVSHLSSASNRTSPMRFSTLKYDSKNLTIPYAKRDDRYNVCTYCQSYLDEVAVNNTTNNSNLQHPSSYIKQCPKIKIAVTDDCSVRKDTAMDTKIKNASPNNQQGERERKSSECLSKKAHNETPQHFDEKLEAEVDTNGKITPTNNHQDPSERNSSEGLIKKPPTETPQLVDEELEYNPGKKKVIRLEGASSSNRPEDVKDKETSVSQKVSYFDRILNPSTDDVRAATKKAESIDMSEEARVKVGFWEKMCGCCHSNPYK